MQLVLTRKITYHLFRTYLPSGLFVIIGWFSLFIPLDHVPGRVTMGKKWPLSIANFDLSCTEIKRGIKGFLKSLISINIFRKMNFIKFSLKKSQNDIFETLYLK